MHYENTALEYITFYISYYVSHTVQWYHRCSYIWLTILQLFQKKLATFLHCPFNSYQLFSTFAAKHSFWILGFGNFAFSTQFKLDSPLCYNYWFSSWTCEAWSCRWQWWGLLTPRFMSCLSISSVIPMPVSWCWTAFSVSDKLGEPSPQVFTSMNKSTL